MPSFLSEDEVEFSGKWRQRKDEKSDSDWTSTDDGEEKARKKYLYLIDLLSRNGD